MSTDIELTSIFSATIERVFDALIGDEALKQWLPGFVSFERLSGDGETGTRFSLTRRKGDQEATESFEVLSHTPPNEVTFLMKGKTDTSPNYRYQYTLTPVSDHTKVRLHIQIIGGDRPPTVVESLVIKMLQSGVQSDWKALEDFLQAN